MRELKFRGLIGDEFVYGAFIQRGDLKFISFDLREQLIFPHTVGQFTGLKDSEGTDIYEGDVVGVHIFGFNGNETEHEFKAVLNWHDEAAAFGLDIIDKGSTSFEVKEMYFLSEVYGIHEESFTVIGNIHQNLELL